MRDDVPMTRKRLLEEGRHRAIEELSRERPELWTDEGRAFWGHECESCGQERPHTEVWGLICDCERQKARGIQETHVEEHRARLIQEILHRARIPRRFARCTFDSFERRNGTEEALDAARAWAESFSLDTEGGLLLAGPWGSGKTHLASAALLMAVDRTLVEARFLSAGKLVSRVRSGPDGGITWRPVREAIESELLLLDDLGQEVGTEFTRDVVARVIFGRYDDARPTLMTSNLGPKGLTDLFGGGVTSRIMEMAATRTLFAKDYRTRERAS